MRWIKAFDFLNMTQTVVTKILSPMIGAYIRHCSGAKLGRRAKFRGWPIILVRGGGEITIGDGFTANSTQLSNPAGLSHRSVIWAFGADCKIRIGNNVGISGASICARKSIIIGDNVLVGVGACIWDNDFHSLPISSAPGDTGEQIRTSSIVIEDNVFIGAKVIILKGVRIGQGSIIAAGTVVTKSVLPNSVAYGNPCKQRRLP